MRPDSYRLTCRQFVAESDDFRHNSAVTFQSRVPDIQVVPGQVDCGQLLQSATRICVNSYARIIFSGKHGAEFVRQLVGFLAVQRNFVNVCISCESARFADIGSLIVSISAPGDEQPILAAGFIRGQSKYQSFSDLRRFAVIGYVVRIIESSADSRACDGSFGVYRSVAVDGKGVVYRHGKRRVTCGIVVCVIARRRQPVAEFVSSRNAHDGSQFRRNRRIAFLLGADYDVESAAYSRTRFDTGIFQAIAPCDRGGVHDRPRSVGQLYRSRPSKNIEIDSADAEAFFVTRQRGAVFVFARFGRLRSLVINYAGIGMPDVPFGQIVTRQRGFVQSRSVRSVVVNVSRALSRHDRNGRLEFGKVGAIGYSRRGRSLSRGAQIDRLCILAALFPTVKIKTGHGNGGEHDIVVQTVADYRGVSAACQRFQSL